MKPRKSIAIVAALTVVGAATAGLGSTSTGLSQVRLVAVGAPLPADPAPAPNLPTADQLAGLLTNLSDAGVSYKTKDGLVQGGIGSGEGHVMDHELRKAYRNGELPLSFTVTNIAPAGPNMASADVAVSGPKLPAPVVKNLTFVDQGGWVLSSNSATALVQAVAGQ